MKNMSSLGLLILLACGGGGTEPSGSRLAFEGTVTDAATGAPIAGVHVEVATGIGLVPQQLLGTTTDTQGRYSLSYGGCRSPAFVLAIITGYNWASETVTCQAEIQTLNLSLTADPQA